MSTIFYLHWNQAELEARVRLLTEAGYQVISHWSTETAARISEPYPAAFVISLDRLPSHGRSVAEWIWEAKKRRHLPIIFEGGQPDKVEATKQKFPQAGYCRTGEVVQTLERVKA